MDEADVLFGILVFLGATLPVGFGVAWFLSHRRVRQLEAQLRGTEISPDSRLDAVERSVELLAEQMEQLGSGQEFLNRLVSRHLERLPGTPASPPVITPH